MRVIDQPFPAHGGAGLLEIDPHDHLKGITVPLTQRSQTAGVLTRGIHIVNGAGAHDHQQAAVLTTQNRLDATTGTGHGVSRRRTDRKILVQQGRSHQGTGLHHMEIGGGGHAPGRETTRLRSPLDATVTRR